MWQILSLCYLGHHQQEEGTQMEGSEYLLAIFLYLNVWSSELISRL